MKNLFCLFCALLLLPTVQVNAQNTTELSHAISLYEKATGQLLRNDFSDVAQIVNDLKESARLFRANGEWENCYAARSVLLQCYSAQNMQAEIQTLANEIITNSETYFGTPNPYMESARRQLGFAYYTAGNYGQALPHLHSGLTDCISLDGNATADVLWYYSLIANIYQRQANYKEALEYYLKALRLSTTLNGVNHEETAKYYYITGSIYVQQKQPEEALDYFSETEKIYVRNNWPISKNQIDLYINTGNIYLQKANYTKALSYYEKGRQLIENSSLAATSDLFLVLTNSGTAYLQQEDYDKALNYYLQAAEIQENSSGKDSVLLPGLYRDIGHVYQQKEQYDNALTYFLKALSMAEAAQPVDAVFLTDLCNVISYLYQLKTDFARAEEYSSKSLKLQEEVLVTDTLRLATTYNTAADVYFQQTRYDEALEYYTKSLGLYLQTTGENLLAAHTYDDIGKVYYYKNQYDKALEAYTESLRIKRKLHGRASLDIAASYNLMGMVYMARSEYDEALSYYIRSLNIHVELHNRENNEVARIYNNIGLLFYNKSDYDEALKYFFRAVNIRKELFGENHEETAVVYNNIGIIYNTKAEYNKALQYYKKSLEININLFGEKHPEVATAYNNIGNIYSKQENYDKALEYYQKSLTIRQTIFPANHLDIAISYNNIGTVYSSKDETNTALDYFLKSLAIKEALLDTMHTEIAAAYNNIGNTYYHSNQYAPALEYLLKSQRIYKKKFGEKHPDLAMVYDNIGQVYLGMEEYSKALRYFHLSMAANLHNFLDISNVTAVSSINSYIEYMPLLKSLQSKAQLFAATELSLSGIARFTDEQRLRLALRNYNAASELITLVRKEIASTTDKLALGQLANSIYKEGVVVCEKLIEISPPENTTHYTEQAFYFAEQNKASVLMESMNNANALKFAGLPESLLDLEKQLSITISFLKKQLIEQKDSTLATQLSSRLFSVRQSYDSLITVFETKYPDYYHLKYSPHEFRISQLQRNLDAQTAVISYIVADSSLIAFVLTRNELKMYTTETQGDLPLKVEIFRSSLLNSGAINHEVYCNLAHRLYQQLFSFSLDSTIKKLVIVPDDVLGIIPFETLLTEAPQQNQPLDFRNLPYLIRNYTISYSYSANLLYETLYAHQILPAARPQFDWIAFAPVFDNQAATQLTLYTKTFESYNSAQQDSTISRGKIVVPGKINPLPGSEEEVKAIFKLFDDFEKKAVLQIHQNATELIVKSSELENYRYVHFATHGFANSLYPELSGIILASDTTNTEDGILYTGEMYNLRLNADLVVLSACETGLGQLLQGEGIIGLSRALLYAGAKNLIVSQWVVPDSSTKDLMISFYMHLLNSSFATNYADKLREAKLELIETKTFSHPFYWSPFILIGQ